MNYIMIAGHLGADPEVRFTSSGKKVTTLRVATNARRGNTDETIWWRVTIWGEQFDKMISYMKKGSAIVVFGDMQKPEIFTDRDGKPQISMNITASSIQFSPFGKPDRAQQDGPGAHQHQESSTTAPINASAPAYQPSQGGGYNPYSPPGSQMGKGVAPMPAGGTYDDEIPF